MPAMTTTVSRWVEAEGFGSIQGRECEVTLQPRPAYCDRGNWHAKLFPRGTLARDIDDQDGWYGGRYYFDHERAKREVEAWLKKRGQWVEG